MVKEYRLIGLTLLIAGIFLATFFYFIISLIPLASMGIASIILGLTSISTAHSAAQAVPPIRISNKLIISLAIALILINILLAVMKNQDLASYFILDAMAYLIITLLYSDINPFVKGTFNYLNMVIFAGFLGIAAIKAIDTLK